MNAADILILHGPPGSGKTTLANAISEILRQSNVAHVVVDVDELARIYPETDGSIKWRMLGSMWPNYQSLGQLKFILPVLIDSAEDLRELRGAVADGPLTICELTASDATLKDRVTEREPNDYWQSKIRGLVDNYISRGPGKKFGEFQVATEGRSVEQSAEEVLDHLNWLS